MYLWLKPGAEKELPFLEERGLVGRMLVQTDPTSGKKYIDTHTRIGDPTSSEIAEALKELVERVTAKIYLHHGFRRQGVYHLNGATLKAESDMIFFKDHWEPVQAVDISGPSMEAVSTIYSLFRQGELTPEEPWEVSPDYSTTPATEPTDGTPVKASI